MNENFCERCKGHISVHEYRKNNGRCDECVKGLDGGCRIDVSAGIQETKRYDEVG